MATVIVPAHNEASLISDCLDSIVRQKGVDAVIVACNGCSDSTAEIVRTRYPMVHCLEIAKPSKVNALNEAEAKARNLGAAFPIFYIDADTTLCDGTVERILTALEESKELLLVAPTPRIDTSESSWFVKQYYRVFLNLPYVKEGVISTGSYVLTEEGRRRFDRFANVIADDGFVRHHFWSQEISNVDGAEIIVHAPKDLVSLIKIKTRSRLGMMELRAKGLRKVVAKKRYPSAFSRTLFSKDCFSLPIYIAIVLLVRARARFQFKRLCTYAWERDSSSR